MAWMLPRIAKAQEGDVFTAADVGDGLMMWERHGLDVLIQPRGKAHGNSSLSIFIQTKGQSSKCKI
jgi:hypothetical protein